MTYNFQLIEAEAEIEKLKAEVERLRAALESIRDESIELSHEIAVAALRGEREKEA